MPAQKKPTAKTSNISSSVSAPGPVKKPSPPVKKTIKPVPPRVEPVPVLPVSSAPLPEPVTALPVLAAPPIPPPPPVAPNPSVKPGLVQAIGVMTLINGILNILLGAGITTTVVLGTFFIGSICAPITILPLVLGIFEIIYSARLLSNPEQPLKPAKSIAVLEILAGVFGNVLSAIVGILALVFYEDSNVKAFFSRMAPGA